MERSIGSGLQKQTRTSQADREAVNVRLMWPPLDFGDLALPPGE
jgi:hypothetical protein